jgi:putative transferase (TIGR04331 family)
MQKNNEHKRNVFLATTALEEFWDTTKPIVFLGAWCRRYSRRKFWEALGDEIVPSVWNNKEDYDEAYRYLNGVYESILPVLSETMNSIHGRQYSDRYWRIVIGPWLFHYVNVIYDRYLFLKAAIDKYPDFETIGLAPENYKTPQDTRGFIDLIYTDLYNLQFYTRILSFLGKEFKKKAPNITNDNSLHKRKRISLGGVLKRVAGVVYSFSHYIPSRKKYIYFSSSYFTPLTAVKLFFKTKGAFKIEYFKYIKHKKEMSSMLNYEDRAKLKDMHWGKDDFEQLLIEMIPMDIPKYYIEEFDDVEFRGQKKYPIEPPIIFSATSWYHNEEFKLWAAKSAESGTLLLGAQHGGNYGCCAHLQHEKHELAITDRYYSWGWRQNVDLSRVVPMPATKFIGRRYLRANNRKKGVVIGACCFPRYLHRIHRCNDRGYANYLKWQFQFVSSLSPEIRSETKIRLYQKDHGWDLVDRWNDYQPDLAIEGWDIPFRKSLMDCRLYVCDHLSTTYAEALASNKPTILFWDTSIFTLRPEAVPYFDELRDAGILHNSPNLAANTINEVYQDVESWWNDRKRQSARENFCNQFARTSPAAIDQWVSEIKAIIQ